MTTTQKTGSASSFVTIPEEPSASAAPMVTKFPVTCAVNSPWSERKPSVSTYPPLKASTGAGLITALSPILERAGVSARRVTFQDCIAPYCGR